MADAKRGRFVWIGIAGAASVGAIGATPVSAPINQFFELQNHKQIERSNHAEALYIEWLELRAQAEIADALLRRQERPSPGRGHRRLKPYVLTMSGSGTDGERELFSVMTFFEKVGTLLAMGRVNAGELSSYLGSATGHWRQLLAELRDRSPRPLDGNRYEQLMHAIVAVEMLSGRARAETNPSPWLPLRLSAEEMLHGRDHLAISATISNPNMIASPVPALRVDLRTHDGRPLGHWLIFPSDDAVPPLGEADIRGRLPWPAEGIASGICLSTDPRDHDSAATHNLRFPGPGDQTRNA